MATNQVLNPLFTGGFFCVYLLMMKRTHLLVDNDPLEKILSGAEKLCKAVSITLGPRGRNVIFRKAGFKAAVTHDGVTVAKAVTLDDPAEDVAADLMKEAAAKMEATTGDGTTTVTILTYYMLKAAAERVKEGVNAMQAKQELDNLGEQAVAKIQEHVITDVGETELIQVATVASANADIGNDVGTAIFKAGQDTPVILNFSDSVDTYTELINGIRIPTGTASPYLIDQGTTKTEVEEPYIIVVDAILRDKEDVLPLLRAVSTLAPEDKKFLLVAQDISGDALSLMVVNKLRGFANISVVRVPQVIAAPSQYLEDIAISTGAKVLSRNTGYSIDDASLDHFGRASKVAIDFTETLIIDGAAIPEDLENYRQGLQETATKGKTAAERNFAQNRLTTLSQQVLSIHVGGQSQSEAEERHYRYEDAIGAARSALRMGVVPGGGSLLYLVGKELGFEALVTPFATVLYNAGLDAADATEFANKLDYGLGVDVTQPQKGVIDMVKAGILDPAESEIEAVKTAVAIAGLLLTSGAMIVEEVIKDDTPQPEYSLNQG